MEAQRFKNQAPQGDLYLRRIQNLPTGQELIERPAGPTGTVVVSYTGRNDSGHPHVIRGGGVKVFQDPSNHLLGYLVVEDGHEAVLEHTRPTDTHAPLIVPSGVFEIRRQRESLDGVVRVVED